MLFTSPIFLLVFFPLSLLGFFACARHSRLLAIQFLAVASTIFYAWWDPRFLLVLVPSILFNYIVGSKIITSGAQTPLAKAWLTVGVAVNLAALIFFKYTTFIADATLSLLGREPSGIAIPLPLGISFFTFTQIAFLVDAYRSSKVGHVGISRFWLFVTYYPHLIAGPIIHHAEMMPQFADEKRSWLRLDACVQGLAFFTIGLFKKVVLADGVAPFASTAFAQTANGDSITTGAAWIGALAYTAQLYFDFSGYSDMAVGLSRILNIELPYNFNSPYKASSIIDFWRRWHITLSRFLRDYLYIPLGGNRKGPVRRQLNLALTMLLGGLWHGAGWTFLIWGGLHGAYLMINHAWRSLAPKTNNVVMQYAGKVAGWALTFTAVVIAWVFFRAVNLDSAIAMLWAMFGQTSAGYGLQELSHSSIGWIAVLLVAAVTLPNSQEIVDRPWSAKLRLPAGTTRGNLARYAQLGFYSTACGILTLITLGKAGLSEFLYFNF